MLYNNGFVLTGAGYEALAKLASPAAQTESRYIFNTVYQMAILKKSFDAFFEKKQSKVAVLKGKWGVGKTYFWENYIADKKRNKSFNYIAYSYISLFGKKSLSEVKKSIFHNATPITTDSELKSEFDLQFKESSKLFNKVPWLRDSYTKVKNNTSWLGRFTKHSDSLPYLDKFSGLISTLEYGLVNNYVICFDDLERKNDSLTVREIMGLIDELALRKKCKVVLIFNQDSLENESDRNEYDSYKEKVVDIELNHSPTFSEVLNIVFDDDYEHLDTINSVIRELDILNIRIISKIERLLKHFKPYFKNVSSELKREFTIHAVVLSWGYYVKDEHLTYENLKKFLKSDSWLFHLADKNKEKTKSEERYSSIASNLNLYSSKLDKHITYYLENGFLNDEPLINDIKELEENVQATLASQRLRNAWKIYSESFSNNLDEFLVSLENILSEDLRYLNLNDFSSAIEILEEFEKDVSKYIDKYTSINRESIKALNIHGAFALDRVNHQKLREEVSKIAEEVKNYNIDDITNMIAIEKGWSPDHIDYLASLSADDYYTWMKSNPENMARKIRSGLLFFKNLGTTNPENKKKFETIAENVIKALKRISKENDFNEMRIKNIYGIEV